MTTPVHAKQLDASVGDAKLVAFGRVGSAAHLPDEESPVEHPVAFSEAQQDQGIDQGRDPNPRERALRLGAKELVGEETGDPALLTGEQEPYGIVERGLLRAHAQQGGERVKDHEPRLECGNGSQRGKQMLLGSRRFGYGREKAQGARLQRGP
jgi:hypothetical protein